MNRNNVRKDAMCVNLKIGESKMKIDEAVIHLDRRLKFLEGHFPSHPSAQQSATDEIESLKIALDTMKFLASQPVKVAKKAKRR